MTPIGITGNFKDVPTIPQNIALQDAHILFPPGFEDILEYELEEHSGMISITILTDDNRDNTVITLDENFYNPSKNDVLFPRFLIEQTLFYGNNIDYFKDVRNKFIFTHLELFYVVLQQRLCELKKFKNAYSNLINTDIRQIKDFMENTPCEAYNAKLREQNSYILLSIFDEKTKSMKLLNNSQCLGNILKAKAYRPSESIMTVLLNNLPIHFSSESMGEKSKFVLQPYEKPLYRSVGYQETVDKDNPRKMIVRSLFPPKQNIPARNKTHVTSDASLIVNFKPTSPFIQDYIVNETKDGYVPKDQCYVEALCVIHPILENGKFLFGEVNASPTFVDHKVYVRETISDQFLDRFIEIGQRVQSSNGKVKVGINLEGKELYIENCSAVTLTRIQMVGTLGVEKLVLQVERSAGNARIDSNTGLKGVTNCKPNLGKITFTESNRVLKPDLAFGMNSFKAGGNGIILARAALATKLGYYSPKHPSKLLNTWDELEINKASDSLPDYTYTDSLGNTQQVQIGLVYARYTELCYIYKKFEPKPFSFEAGRVLHSLPDQSFFNTIWEKYVRKDHKEFVNELEKILLDKNNIFDDSIPTYSADAIRENKIFTTKDLIFNIRTATASMTKLLDEEWNQGFFINLKRYGGGIIRIPSAKVLKNFCSQTDDKMYMYPGLLLEISKIISNVLNRTFGLLYPKNTESSYSKNTPVIRYYREIKGLLFTTDDKKVMLIQALSRPEVPGIGMKQSSDWILPDNTCVIMCNKTYNRALDSALKNTNHNHLVNGFYGFHGRSPFLWSEQCCPVKIWNQDDFRMYLHAKHNIKLENYLDIHKNNDVIIFSNNILKKSQSDKL